MMQREAEMGGKARSHIYTKSWNESEAKIDVGKTCEMSWS